MGNFYKYLFFLLYRHAKSIFDSNPKFYAFFGLVPPLSFIAIIFLKLFWMFGFFLVKREEWHTVAVIGLLSFLPILFFNWCYFIKDELYLEIIEANKNKDEAVLSRHTLFLFIFIIVLAAIAMFLPVNYIGE